MRWSMVLVLLLGVACSKKRAPPKNEFEAFERKFVAENELLAEAMRRDGREVADKDIPRSYRAVFIGPSGVFVDSKLVATLAELDTKRTEITAAVEANAALLPTVGWRPSMTFDLDAQPASVAIAALRLFAGHETIFNVRRDDPEIPQRSSSIICTSKIRTQPSADREAVHLSVLLDPGRTWVGLSRVNEFQEILDSAGRRDFEKLETTLKEHKASVFFADRSDLELGAGAATSGDVIAAFDIACKVGFFDVAVLERAHLSAVPSF